MNIDGYSSAPVAGLDGAVTVINDQFYIGENDTDSKTLLVGDLPTITPSLIELPQAGTPDYKTIGDMNNTFHSAGFIDGGAITLGGANTVDIASGNGYLRSTDSSVGTLYFVKWAESKGISIPDMTTKYIGIEWNAGSPQVVSNNLLTDYNYNTNFPMYKVSAEGLVLHSQSFKHKVSDHANNMIQRLIGVNGITRADGGLIISATGTRNFSSTAGLLWFGLEQYIIPTIDTASSGSFDAYHTDGIGGFTYLPTLTAWEEKYDNSGTLSAVAVNQHYVLWWYVEADGEYVLFYGTSNGNLASAEAESPPSSLPERMTEHSILLGKFICKQGTVAPIEELSAFTTQFTSAQVSSHLDLSNIGTNTHAQIDTHIADATLHYTQANIVATGALDSGSITSNFGSINNGASDITTTGLITGGQLAIDQVAINNSSMSLTGATNTNALNIPNNLAVGFKIQDGVNADFIEIKTTGPASMTFGVPVVIGNVSNLNMNNKAITNALTINGIAPTDQGTSTISSVNFASMTIDDVNINGGSIAYSASDGLNAIRVPDNQANALFITDLTQNYLQIVSTTGLDEVKLLQNTSITGSLVVSGNISSTSGSIGGLSAVELTQLGNIDTSTISVAQWGYVGGLNQALTTSSAVNFGTVSANDFYVKGGSLDFASATGPYNIVVADNKTAALDITDGTQYYIRINSTTGSDEVGILQKLNMNSKQINNLIDLKFEGLVGTNKIIIPDNQASALYFEDTVGSTAYLGFNSTTGSENVSIFQDLQMSSNDILGVQNITGNTGTLTLQSADGTSKIELADSGTMTLTASSIISLDNSTIETIDPLIHLAEGNSADLVNVGWYGQYNDGVDKFPSIYRPKTGATKFVFAEATTEPTSATITPTTYYDLHCRNLISSQYPSRWTQYLRQATTQTITTGTEALIVADSQNSRNLTETSTSRITIPAGATSRNYRVIYSIHYQNKSAGKTHTFYLKKNGTAVPSSLITCPDTTVINTISANHMLISLGTTNYVELAVGEATSIDIDIIRSSILLEALPMID